MSPFLLSGIVAVSAMLTLAACEQIKDANQAGLDRDRQIVADRARVRTEAAQLALGEATLADCIATRCQTLNLDGQRLTDFSVVNDLDHVEALMVSRSNFDALADIQDMVQLKELHISYTDVRDLSLVSNFPSLTVLHFEGGAPEVDRSVVAQLTGLTDLALSNVDSDFDASFIRNMPRLENLIIRGWDTIDLQPLRNHPSLKNVEFSGELPADQSILLTIPRLEGIMFYNERELDDAIRETLDSRGQLRRLPPVVVC
jgi:hypothetical protein